MRKSLFGLAPVVVVALAQALGADVFDLQSPSDNTTSSENELIHRSDQFHDLAAQGGVADVDFYRIVAKPYSSYEVVVDATDEDITPLTVNLVDSDGSTTLQSSIAVSSLGYSRALRWQNTTSEAQDRYIKILSGGCTTTCDGGSVYRIRAYDTSYVISRFYDHDTMETTVWIQNPTNYSGDVRVYYWKGNTLSPNLLATDTATLGARSLTEFLPEVEGYAGYITVTSTFGYGELRGKAEQFDYGEGSPSWDHMMSPRR